VESRFVVNGLVHRRRFEMERMSGMPANPSTTNANVVGSGIGVTVNDVMMASL